MLKQCIVADRKVALLTEGVDRNGSILKQQRCKRGSPSSRRAWIEIVSQFVPAVAAAVALLTEGVDRNNEMTQSGERALGRPPRGGRG